MKIIVELPDARQHYGRLRLVDDSGHDLIEPVPAIGRADLDSASSVDVSTQ